jgi:hypothetical protein
MLNADVVLMADVNTGTRTRTYRYKYELYYIIFWNIYFYIAVYIYRYTRSIYIYILYVFLLIKISLIFSSRSFRLASYRYPVHVPFKYCTVCHGRRSASFVYCTSTYRIEKRVGGTAMYVLVTVDEIKKL